MGYESRITVINRHSYEAGNNKGHYDESLATFELSCVDQSLLSVFAKEYDNGRILYLSKEEATDLYMSGFEVKKDAYGEVPKECGLKPFYSALLKCEANEHYRRYQMLITFLTQFIGSNEWDEIIIVHTGY